MSSRTDKTLSLACRAGTFKRPQCYKWLIKVAFWELQIPELTLHNNNAVNIPTGAGGLHIRQGSDGGAAEQLQGSAAEAGQHPPHPQIPRANQPRLQPLLQPRAPDQTVRPQRPLPTKPHQDLQRTRQTSGGRDNMTRQQWKVSQTLGELQTHNCWDKFSLAAAEDWHRKTAALRTKEQPCCSQRSCGIKKSNAGIPHVLLFRGDVV